MNHICRTFVETIDESLGFGIGFGSTTFVLFIHSSVPREIDDRYWAKMTMVAGPYFGESAC